MNPRNSTDIQLLLLRAHGVVKRICQTDNLDGYCLEASVVIVEYLRRRDVKNVRLIRRNCEGEAHWHFAINEQEYDPTCADWTNPPTGTTAGTIYKLPEHSPHHDWPATNVSERAAYESVGIKRKNGNASQPLRSDRQVLIHQYLNAHHNDSYPTSRHMDNSLLSPNTRRTC